MQLKNTWTLKGPTDEIIRDGEVFEPIYAVLAYNSFIGIRPGAKLERLTFKKLTSVLWFCGSTRCSTSYTPRGIRNRSYGSNCFIFDSWGLLHKINSGEKSYSQGPSWGSPKWDGQKSTDDLRWIFKNGKRNQLANMVPLSTHVLIFLTKKNYNFLSK